MFINCTNIYSDIVYEAITLGPVLNNVVVLSWVDIVMERKKMVKKFFLNVMVCIGQVMR